MASRCVVPVRAKASLTSGSTPSRRPSRQRGRQGLDLRIHAPHQPFATPGAHLAQQTPPDGARSLGIATQPVRVVDGQSQVDPLAAEEVTIVELARVERSGDGGELADRLDRFAADDIAAIAVDDRHRRGRRPAAIPGRRSSPSGPRRSGSSTGPDRPPPIPPRIDPNSPGARPAPREPLRGPRRAGDSRPTEPARSCGSRSDHRA